MSEMRLEYQLTPADIKEALAFRSRTIQAGRGVIGWLLFVAVAILLFIWLRHQNHPPVRQHPPQQRHPTGVTEWVLAIVPWLLIIAFIWFFVIRNIRGRAETLWKKDPRLQQPQVVELSDEGLRITNSLADNFLRWPNFVGWAETRNLLLLLQPNDARLMIPKRAAGDEAQLNALRQFIRDHIHTRTGGFEILPVNAAAPTLGDEPRPGGGEPHAR